MCTPLLISGQSKKPCPTGTFSDAINLASKDSCQACPRGYYCGQEALTVATTLCQDGFYCGGGAEVSYYHSSLRFVKETGEGEK